MEKIISKSDTYSSITIKGDIRKIELKKDKKSNEELVLEFRIGFKGGTISAYAKSEIMINEMLNLKIGDVIKIKGKFINTWYKGAKGNFAAIDNIETWKKIGVIENLE